MTAPGPRQAPAPFNSRPLLVLLFFATGALCIVVGLLSDPNWWQVIAGILFLAVGNLTRTIGVYRLRLGLDL